MKRIFLFLMLFIIANLSAQNVKILFETTRQDSLNYFWSRYIKNAVYELNPANGFNSVSEVTTNNLVRYCLSEYYRKNGFGKLKVQKSVVPIYKIPVGEIEKIYQADFNQPKLQLNDLEEAVYNPKTGLVSFDARILSAISGNTYYLDTPVPEKIVTYTDGSLKFVVQFIDEDKKPVGQMIYTMGQRSKGSYYFIQSEYKINPDYYKMEMEDQKQVIFNLAPQFINDLVYLNQINEKSYFYCRDYLSGINNFYSLETATGKVTFLKRIIKSKKKDLACELYDSTFVFLDDEKLDSVYDADLNQVKNESYRKRKDYVYISYMDSDGNRLIEPQYDNTLVNQYGQFTLYLGSYNEDSDMRDYTTSPIGSWFYDPDSKDFKQIIIDGFNPHKYLLANEIILFKKSVVFRFKEYSDDMKESFYQIIKLDLKKLTYRIYSFNSSVKDVEIIAMIDENTLLISRMNHEGYRSYFIMKI